jgi:hypothetical protein
MTDTMDLDFESVLATGDTAGMNTTKANRMRAKAARQQVILSRKGDDFGATARTGRGVVRVPGALVRPDGLISTERLESLASLANTTGFALSVTQGYERRTGYAAPVRNDRDRVVGTYVKGGRTLSGVTGYDVMEYVRDNIDLLSKPNNLLVASRDRRTGVVTLNVCAVVLNYALARDMARVAGCAWFVNVQDGTKVAVRKVA